jgi:hypothetical protein
MTIQPASDSPNLTDLERSVLETACSATGVDARFCQQIDVATVTVRTPSGVGFVTGLSIPAECHVRGLANGMAIPLIAGEHPELPSGAEFVIQVKNGCINSIEAFCFEGMWPTDESLFKILVGS